MKKFLTLLWLFATFVYLKKQNNQTKLKQKRIDDVLRQFYHPRFQHPWRRMLQPRSQLLPYSLFLQNRQLQLEPELNDSNSSSPRSQEQLSSELNNSIHSQQQNLNQILVPSRISDSTSTSHIPRLNLQKLIQLSSAFQQQQEHSSQQRLLQLPPTNIKEKEEEEEEEEEKENPTKEVYPPKFNIYDENELKSQFLNDENEVSRKLNIYDKDDPFEQRQENSFLLNRYLDDMLSEFSDSNVTTPRIRQSQLQEIFKLKSSPELIESTNASTHRSSQMKTKKASPKSLFNKVSKESTGPGFVQSEPFKTGPTDDFFSDYVQRHVQSDPFKDSIKTRSRYVPAFKAGSSRSTGLYFSDYIQRDGVRNGGNGNYAKNAKNFEKTKLNNGNKKKNDLQLSENGVGNNSNKKSTNSKN